LTIQQKVIHINIIDKKFTLISLLLIALLAANAKAESYLELGAGMGTVHYPAYAGSKTYKNFTAPFPYFKYIGERLTVNKDGINKKLFNIDGMILDLSFGATLPASSVDLEKRQGMPNLAFTFGVGPKIQYFMRNEPSSKIFFELPARATFALDSINDIDYIGIVTTPQIAYRTDYKNFETTLRAGINFASQEYNQYFYGVASQYATSTRPEYDANGGFSAFKYKASISYAKNHWWSAAFITYYDLHNAVFKDSPMMETSNAFYTGFAVAYIFYADKW
jgi:outer membrane protein